MTSEIDWPVVRLDDVADDITVGHVGPMATEYVPVGIPFLRSQNVEPFRVNLEDVKYVSEDFHNRLAKSALQPGDVVIVRRGRPGSAAVIPPDLQVANCADLVIIRPGPELDAHFLTYFINSAGSGHVASRLVGAVQQHFNVGSARTLCIPLPSLREQRRIARALSVLENKIELNRRMNRTLESIARAIFKSWFVDFDPVRKKMDGKTGNELGLPPSLAALFPGYLTESRLGPIPAGWEVAAIGDVVTIVGGSTPSTKNPDYWGGDLAFATPKDLAGLECPMLLSTQRRITAAGAATISSGVLEAGTVLLSSRAPIGYLAITEIPVCVNQGFIAMACCGGLPNHYLLNWARANMESIVASANGTTFMEVSKRAFRPLPIVVPPKPVLDAFVAVAEPLTKRVRASLLESQTLAESRRRLLSELMDGHLRIDMHELQSRIEETPGQAKGDCSCN